VDHNANTTPTSANNPTTTITTATNNNNNEGEEDDGDDILHNLLGINNETINKIIEDKGSAASLLGV
jgi:hypothetical protein